MAGVTTATIPEDWGNLSGQGQKFQIVVHVSFLRVDNMRLDYKAIWLRVWKNMSHLLSQFFFSP